MLLLTAYICYYNFKNSAKIGRHRITWAMLCWFSKKSNWYFPHCKGIKKPAFWVVSRDISADIWCYDNITVSLSLPHHRSILPLTWSQPLPHFCTWFQDINLKAEKTKESCQGLSGIAHASCMANNNNQPLKKLLVTKTLALSNFGNHLTSS